MTAQDVLARAQRCLGRGVTYVLGMGGMDPAAEFPFSTPEKGCDCSGFAMWCLGLSREVGGVWYGTDQIVADATGPGTLFHAVSPDQVRVGDLIVYAHRTAGHHGHVGVVSLVDGGRAARAIHCSMGNWSVGNDAIQQTGVGVWTMAPGMIVARLKTLAEVAA